MKKKIIIEKRYINIPVNNDESYIHVIIRDFDSQNIIRYFDVSLGGEEYDFIAYYDMRKFIGKEIEIEIENIEFLEKFLSALIQSDSPLGLEDVYQEKHRPQLHFSSKRGWLNDPNGLVYYKGEYHMFYQHNPFAKKWGNMHWGHAVSNDLIHWQEKGEVLYPDEMGTMYSGSGIVDWNNDSGLQKGEHPPILLFYTAAGDCAPERCEYTQCIAYSVDGGDTFEKYTKNPVVGYVGHRARDPKVIWHEESQKWIMALFNGDHKKTFYLLTSENLLDWEITQNIEIPHGRECAEFFPIALDGCEDNIKWIFMDASGRYLIGDFDGETFKTEAGPFSSFGRFGEDCAYAGQMWNNAPNDRKTMIHWQRGECHAASFSQTMTIPVDLSLKSFSDGMYLCAEPVEEFKKLRTASWEFTDVEMIPFNCTPSEFFTIPEGRSWDIELELNKDCETVINVCGVNIALDAKAREIRMSAVKLPFASDTKELNIRIIVDRSSIEIFGGEGRIWFAKRKLTTLSKPVLFPNQNFGSGSLKKVKIHKLNSIWNKKSSEQFSL